jgi:hypothetical protein
MSSRAWPVITVAVEVRMDPSKCTRERLRVRRANVERELTDIGRNKCSVTEL